jgi:glycosyltransferase involved in cell wall biosynthesis
MKSVGIVAYTDYLTDARVTRHAEAACQAGYAVDVFTPAGRGRKGRLAANGVTVHRLRGRYYRGSAKVLYVLSYANFLIRCLVQVTRIHLRNPFRVIQVCNMPDVLVFSTALAKLMGAKIVLDIHDPMPRTYMAKFPASAGQGAYRLILWLERLSAAFADRVMTVHEPVKRDILLKDGIPPDKVSVVANFPDEGIFRVQAPYDISLPLRMVYYGTVSARFGLEGVLSAIVGVRQKDRLCSKSGSTSWGSAPPSSSRTPPTRCASCRGSSAGIISAWSPTSLPPRRTICCQ